MQKNNEILIMEKTKKNHFLKGVKNIPKQLESKRTADVPTLVCFKEN